MTSRGQGTCSREDLVDGQVVDTASWFLSVFLRGQFEERQVNEQFLWVTVVKLMGFVVPLASLKVESVDHSSIFWLFSDILICHCVVIDVAEGELVDSDGVLSGVVLESGSQESLWEEESGHPEDLWSSIGNPLVQEVDSVVTVLNPGSQWLERQESNLGPQGWDLVIEDRASHAFKIFTHDDFSLKCLLHTDQGGLH